MPPAKYESNDPTGYDIAQATHKAASDEARPTCLPRGLKDPAATCL